MILIGLLLLAAALFLVGRNVLNDLSAGDNSEEIINELYSTALADVSFKEYSTENTPPSDIPDYIKHPDMDLPVEVVNGIECVAILSIPSMDKEFPVVNELTDYNLRYGPCLYSGSPYRNNFVIGAHNNSSHFGGLIRNVVEGDQITLIDMVGNIFNYTVEYIEVLEPYETKKMIESDWDLSLFTCTWDLGSRYTVRCLRSDNDINVVTIG